jgi:hypothetical protein
MSAALGAVLIVATACAGEAPSDVRGRIMTANVAACEVNRYGLALLIEVRRAEPGPWTPDQNNPLNQRRSTVIIGELLETLQGQADIQAPRQFTITVTQRRPASGRIADYYGPWSYVELQPGLRLLVFCNRPTPTSSLEAMLAQDDGLVIDLKGPAYPHAVEDVRLAISLKRCQDFPAALGDAVVQREVLRQRSELGPIMARFLGDVESTQPGRADELIFGLLTDAAVPVLCRIELLRLLVESMTILEDVPVARRVRLVRALTSILQETSPAARELKSVICQAYLRNIIFTADNEPLLDAAAAFPAPEERRRVAELVAGQELGAGLRRRLEDWLQAH